MSDTKYPKMKQKDKKPPFRRSLTSSQIRFEKLLDVENHG